MDPNITLLRIRELSHRLNRTYDELTELAELVEELDHWMTRGGFLPKAWEHKPRTREWWDKVATGEEVATPRYEREGSP